MADLKFDGQTVVVTGAGGGYVSKNPILSLLTTTGLGKPTVSSLAAEERTLLSMI